MQLFYIVFKLKNLVMAFFRNLNCFDLALRAETNTGDFNGVRGRTTGDPVGLVNHSMPHVHVALGVDSERFLDEFVERMAEVCR